MFVCTVSTAVQRHITLKWILEPTSNLVSRNAAFYFCKGCFFIEMERKFGQVDSYSVWEQSDVTSFSNVTS